MVTDKIIQGDCIDVLKTLPDSIVNTCITSPPYFGLRDYGVEGQIGLEESPEEYTQKLVDVFHELKRVLKDDGTLWLNLGDSYASNGGVNRPNTLTDILKPKDLIGIPWRVAFALQQDGWYLRQDIIWHKPNPMPESVTDRCTKSHEYIFLLSKSARYYYDYEAVKIPASQATLDRNRYGFKGAFKGQFLGSPNEKRWQGGRPIETPEFSKDGKANRRSVWTVATKPFSEAHFATFPEELINPCVLAGSPEGGLVYDPFMGAGTTAYVAKKLGRHFLGSELNPAYIEIANRRVNSIEQSLFL